MKHLVLAWFNNPPYQTILKWRWLTLFGSLGVVLFELYEGHEITDASLWSEVIVYALAIPSTIWLLLTWLAHSLSRQAQSRGLLEQHRRFTQQLVRHQEWGELAAFLTRFPGAFLPVEHTTFFIYDHRKARLKLVAEWSLSPAATASIGASASSGICHTCLSTGLPKLHAAVACAFILDAAGDLHTGDFCLPLEHDGLLVGILRLRCRPGKTLTQDQIEFLNAASSEIALALVLSTSHPTQIAQVRVEAQFNERRYIAHELHDEVAQQLGYLHLSLDRLASDRRFIMSRSVRDELQRMRTVAGDVYERIRNTLALLHTHRHFNLAEAIASHSRFVAQQAQLQVDLTIEGEPRSLPVDLCQPVFGLVREGLNNVEKHAQARRAQIALHWFDSHLGVSVIDDGVGFDPVYAERKSHYGLAMMRESVEKLGGEFALRSSPGQGTQLNFTIPLASPQTSPHGDSPFADASQPLPDNALTLVDQLE